MSNSQTSLPARANLEFLKKQSKDLQRAFAGGDAGAIERIRQYLPRAGSLNDADAGAFELSLQEAQHALACEYGHGKWEDLIAATEDAGFEDLAQLTDRETQILMREIDQKVLVQALVGAPAAVEEKFLGNMSERVQGFIREEIDLVGSDEASVQQARTQMLQQVRALPEWIAWPPGSASPAGAPEEYPADPRLEHIRRPLLDVSIDDLAGTILALADRARRLGILSLEGCQQSARGTLLTEGIRLIVDGTEPDLVVDMLEIRAATILRNRTIRGAMAMEGWLALYSGDNPAIVAQKLTTYFVEEPEDDVVPRRQPTVESLSAGLRHTPMSKMALSQLVEFFRDMAQLARQDGVSALAPLQSLVDEPVLAAGMAACVPADPGMGKLMGIMEHCLQQQREALHERHCLVIKGIGGIQMGRKPEVLVDEARAWAQQQVAALGPARSPSAVTPL